MLIIVLAMISPSKYDNHRNSQRAIHYFTGRCPKMSWWALFYINLQIPDAKVGVGLDKKLVFQELDDRAHV